MAINSCNKSIVVVCLIRFKNCRNFNFSSRKTQTIRNKNLQASDFVVDLLHWFRENKRDLPWRRTRDPYAIWVSEIMLQQTQVLTVIPFYYRFMDAFPSVGGLASAKLQDVLKIWEGLGYYARARNLHKAAQIIMEKYSGGFPDNLDDVLKLPGIGRYTAGAILSIAFDKPIPILDGNAARVLSRVLLFEEPINTHGAKEKLWQAAKSLLPADNPGEFNQALMELGALVCTPQNPSCEACPLQEICLAKAAHREREIPIRNKTKQIPHVHVSAGVIWKDGEILITLRPTDKMLGGLWEFPGGKCKMGESFEACALREISEELGIEVEVTEHFMDVKHAYSHFKMTLHMFHCRYISGKPVLNGVDAFQWVTPEGLLKLPFPAADGKVIREILRQSPSIGKPLGK